MAGDGRGRVCFLGTLIPKTDVTAMFPTPHRGQDESTARSPQERAISKCLQAVPVPEASTSSECWPPNLWHEPLPRSRPCLDRHCPLNCLVMPPCPGVGTSIRRRNREMLCGTWTALPRPLVLPQTRLCSPVLAPLGSRVSVRLAAESSHSSSFRCASVFYSHEDHKQTWPAFRAHCFGSVSWVAALSLQPGCLGSKTASPLTSCVALGKLLYLSVPPLPYRMVR